MKTNNDEKVSFFTNDYANCKFLDRYQCTIITSRYGSLVYTYDAAGNRTKVEYAINNTTSTVADISKIDTVSLVKKINEQVLKVDALYPNPTLKKK